MNAKPILLSIASLAFVALSASSTGCIANGGGTDGKTDPDAITQDEVLAGQSFNGDEENAEPADDTSGLASDTELEDVQDDGYGGQSACHHAVGYRHGVRMDICVVPVDGKWVEVHTAAAFKRMASAASNSGVHLYVVSGFRTMAEQRYLYQLYKEGRGNLAAPPGYSNHQSGHALDLNTSAPGVYHWLELHGASFGFRRTVPSEAWHWEHW